VHQRVLATALLSIVWLLQLLWEGQTYWSKGLALFFKRSPQFPDYDAPRAIIGGRFDSIIDVEDEL
jgi:hypothetical protein